MAKKKSGKDKRYEIRASSAHVEFWDLAASIGFEGKATWARKALTEDAERDTGQTLAEFAAAEADREAGEGGEG